MPISAQARAAHLAAVKRRRSFLVPDLARTHYFPIPTEPIDTDVVFGARARPATFHTAVEVTANGGVHRGLVFTFGGSVVGLYLYLNDSVVGMVVSGDTDGSNGFVSEYDFGGEIPVGLKMDLILAVGHDMARLYINGKRAADGAASAGYRSGVWAGLTDGAFAAAGTDMAHALCPAAARQAPDGFTVIKPLSVYMGQIPRHYV